MFNTCRAPLLMNYGHAKDWHDKTLPIRGNKDKVRPLGSRRHWQMGSIDMEGDNVVLKYYGQKLVVWHPDDSLAVYMPRWCTAFEPDKLANFLPPRVGFEWNKGRLILANYWDNMRVQVRDDEPIRMKAVGVETFNGQITRKFEIENVPDTFQYVKRRGSSLKIMRERFTPFLDWVRVVTAITPRYASDECGAAKTALFHAETHVTEKEYKRALDWYRNTPWGDEVMQRKYNFSYDERIRDSYPMSGRNAYRRKIIHFKGVVALYNMMLEENQDQWLNALQIIAEHNGDRRWESGEVHYIVTEERVQQYVERLVCAVNREAVFERVPLERGRIPSKTHLEFFADAKFQYFEETDKVSVISV